MVGDLTTVDRVKLHGGIKDDTYDDLLADLVAMSSQMWKTHLSRAILRSVLTESYNGNAARALGSALYTNEYPVNSVTLIQENGTTLTSAFGYSTTADVIVDGARGVLYRQTGASGMTLAYPASSSPRWASGFQNIGLTYDQGWDYPRKGTESTAPLSTDLPFDLERGVIEVAVLLFKDKTRIGDKSQRFMDYTLEYVREINPFVNLVATQYARGFRP